MSWYDPYSEGLPIWGAWMAEGAASYAASKVDVSGHGHDLAAVGLPNTAEPSWNAVDGWVLTAVPALIKCLNTGFIASNTQAQSVIVKFSHAVGYAVFLDTWNTVAPDGDEFGLIYQPGIRAYYLNGNSPNPNVFHAGTSAIIGLAGTQGYWNCANEGVAIPIWSVVPNHITCYLGAINMDGSILFGMTYSSYVQALAIYDGVLTDTQVFGVVQALGTDCGLPEPTPPTSPIPAIPPIRDRLRVTPLRSSQSRVFLTKGGACPTHQPLYHSCVVAGKVTKPHGDVQTIEVPERKRYGEWVHADTVHVGKTAGASSVELNGHYALNLASELLAIARAQRGYGNGSDVQLHMGNCKMPNQFYPYDKVLLLQEAFVSDWNINTPKQIGNAAVNEAVTFQGTDLYEIVPLAADVAYVSSTNTNIVDITTVEDCCGDCQVYAITNAVGYLVYWTTANGAWETDAITSIGAAENPTCLAVLGDNVVVFSNDSNSCHYASLTDLAAGVSNWVETATGFTQRPTCCWGVGTMVWVGARGGYVYKLENLDTGLIAVHAGLVDIAPVKAIHALDENRAVAVGDGGMVIYTLNQTTWQQATSPVGVSVDLISVWMWDEKVWWVGDDNSTLWYTLDSGKNWAVKKVFS